MHFHAQSCLADRNVAKRVSNRCPLSRPHANPPLPGLDNSDRNSGVNVGVLYGTEIAQAEIAAFQW
jgi:hypothetical protein